MIQIEFQSMILKIEMLKKIQMKLNAFDCLQSNGYQECPSHAEKRKSQITN